MKFVRAFSILALVLIFGASVAAQDAAAVTRRARVAVLDFGYTELGRRAADRLAQALASDTLVQINDREESRAAARGSGYAGSLNLTIEDARQLGAVIDCDIYLTGDAQTLRRSPSVGPIYYESYAAIFMVSARTGHLIQWERPSFRAASPEEAEKSLFEELGSKERVSRYARELSRALGEEQAARALAQSHGAPLIEEVPEEGSVAANGLRLPQPYRRLQPVYPETAAAIEAEGTVDVLVDIDVTGEVARVEIVRWAGFGLDDATTSAVRRMHFRPAIRSGVAVPMRVLLRYNFRRPPKQKS